MNRHSSAIVAAVVGLLCVLAIAATWPLASDPAHLSLAGPFNNDFHFNTYVVLWGAHALTTDPLSLHHTNMFWPERYTFAYSDMSLSHSLLVLPVLWLSYNPTLAINVLILLSMVIGGTGAFLLARHVTGSDLAAVVGAVAFIFNPAHFARHLQIQYFGDHWAPWLALGLVLWLERRTVRWALIAALFFILHALTGSHAAVFAALIALVLIGVYALRSGQWRESWLWRGLATFGLLVAIVLVPIFYPYLLVHDRLVGERGDSPEVLLEGSARARDLLTGGSRFDIWLEERWGWPSALTGGRLRAHLFPGWILLALAALAALRRRQPSAVQPRPGDAVAWGVLLVVCLLLALGPPWRVYDWLAMLPGIRLIRVPSRFVLPGLLGLTMLSAFGVAALRRRLSATVAGTLLAAATLLFAFEATFAPLSTATVSGRPDAVSAWLAGQPGDFAILELPIQVDNLTAHSRQLLQSVFHWKKLLVGYSGWRSEAVRARLERLNRTFPQPRSLNELAALGVRYLILVGGRNPPDLEDRMLRTGRLERVRQFDQIAIWELDGPAP